MVVGSVVLDERGDGGDVAGVHGGHAGSAADRRSLVVHVQHPVGGDTSEGVNMWEETTDKGSIICSQIISFTM